MNKNRTVSKILTVIMIAIIGIGISACQKKEDKLISKDEKINKTETVKVESGSLTPTFSTKTEIKEAGSFKIQSDEKGNFKANVTKDMNVKKGQILGYVGSKKIIAPVDGTVIKICDDADVPKNYPLFELSYTGFAIDVKAPDFLQAVTRLDNLNAKFQVQDGIGPEGILAVVLSSEDTSALKCLISHESDVRMGQLATVAITAETKNDVMILPLSVVAGRLKSGSVMKVVKGEAQNVQVKLGATDGAYIEIVSGLEVGDEVLTLAPNLDPRKN